ncbi:hypothetical protein D3C86_1789640 [compost metagenome]
MITKPSQKEGLDDGIVQTALILGIPLHRPNRVDEAIDLFGIHYRLLGREVATWAKGL